MRRLSNTALLLTGRDSGGALLAALAGRIVDDAPQQNAIPLGERPGLNPMFESKRSSPLRPAIWMTGVLVWATVIGLFLHVPTWAGIFLCGLTGASFLWYVALYAYLLIKDPESLRRERIEAKDEHALQRGSLGVDPVVVRRDKVQSAVERPDP